MTARVVLVTGPPLAGVTALAGALRQALPGHTVVEQADAADAVVFAVSAAAPLRASDLGILDAAARSTDLVIGVVTKADVHHDWPAVRAADQAACAARAARYRTMPWLAVAAAPRRGDPRLADLVQLLTGALADPALARRNRLRANETRLSEQIAAASAADPVAAGLHERRDAELRAAREIRSAQTLGLRNRVQQARLDLIQLARGRVADLHGELAHDASGWRWGQDFVAHAAARAEQLVAELDDAVRARSDRIADELMLSRPDTGPPTPVPQLARPGPTSRGLEMRLMTLLGAGFGLGVALAAGRLLVGLAPGAAGTAAVVGAAVGLLLTLWVVGMRGLLHERAHLDRWVGSVAAALRSDTEALVGRRLLAAEAALTAESVAAADSAAARTAERVAAIDARLRTHATAVATTAMATQRRLCSLRAALRAVRSDLNSVTAE
ncbi:hypothetical protein [Mycolicibacterium bacteremicum]|uniref:hypothetical protein n=1 Tax=Mycolicibacterium bacteremicum TaxID=564198 RepID=UPI000D6B847C|nr:hypothetical protein [Mycolicibacterium bacteremicum]MCV7432592.1 hypothetical protein [Mycolicibacterium bacteremicum]